MYQCGRVTLFSSGICAISAIFNVYAKKNTSFVVSDELYRDTFRVLKYLKGSIENFDYVTYDTKDGDDLLRKLKAQKNCVLVFMESCSNPGGLMISKSIFKEIKKINKEVVICVDNSWLSASLFNPIKYQADMVVESLSKYCGGGNIIMGAVAGTSKVMKEIKSYQVIMGNHVSPFDCWVLSNSLESLDLRMEHIAKCSLEIAKYLEKHEKVNRVLYPLLKSHPSYDIACKDLVKGGPGIIFFHISKGKDDVINMCNQSELILYATSYGKSHSLFNPHPWEGDSDFYDDKKDEVKKKGTFIRFAVGFTCKVEETKKELDRVLNLELK